MWTNVGAYVGFFYNFHYHFAFFFKTQGTICGS